MLVENTPSTGWLRLIAARYLGFMTLGAGLEIPVVVFAEVEEALIGLTVSPRDAADLDERLGSEQIIIVFCSRRTRAELEAVRQDAGLFHPFICEWGAGVFVPGGYFPFPIAYAREIAGYQAIELGRPYADVVDGLHRTARRLGIDIVGFNDMSIDQVASACEMPLLRARLAKLREYSEPFRLLEPTAAARRGLKKGLQGAHLTCTFDHPYSTAGSPVDPSPGVGLLTSMYRRACGDVLTVDCYSGKRNARVSAASTFADWVERIIAVATAVRVSVEPFRRQNQVHT